MNLSLMLTLQVRVQEHHQIQMAITILKIPSETDVTLTFSHITYKTIQFTVNLKKGQVFEYNPVMSLNIEQIGQL